MATVPFRIDALNVGAGTMGLCRLPGATPDLTALAAWRPDLVITLTPLDEAARLGLPDPAAAFGGLGALWVHFPVGDYATPPPGADWSAVSGQAQAVLAAGGRVLVHCRAGLGRSGMVALRLMVETGEDPATALSRLRAARPGAVETPAQERWGKAPAPGAERNQLPR